MTDVERFFRRLVVTLAATNPARLRQPLPLDDITESILPYRANRRVLQVDTVEDYEAVLLRLCAEEGDLVRTEPDEARERFAEESRSPNPDLTVLYSFENVELTLRPEQLAWALAPEPDSSYAPPSLDAEGAAERDADVIPVADLLHHPEPAVAAGLPGVEELREPPDDVELPDVAERVESRAEARPICRHCGGALPVHRPVNFCPHCGQNQSQILCPECGSEVEPGWRHCVNCGAAVGKR